MSGSWREQDGVALLWRRRQQDLLNCGAWCGRKGNEDHSEPGWTPRVEVAPFPGLGEGGESEVRGRRVRGSVVAVSNERRVLDVIGGVEYAGLNLGGKFGAGENRNREQREAEPI